VPSISTASSFISRSVSSISKIAERCREKVASFRQNESFSSQAVTIVSRTATIVRHFSTFSWSRATFSWESVSVCREDVAVCRISSPSSDIPATVSRTTATFSRHGSPFCEIEATAVEMGRASIEMGATSVRADAGAVSSTDPAPAGDRAVRREHRAPARPSLIVPGGDLDPLARHWRMSDQAVRAPRGRQGACDFTDRSMIPFVRPQRKSGQSERSPPPAVRHHTAGGHLVSAKPCEHRSCVDSLGR
jgi:hypothetical protein